jgi:DNA-binding XRE family transcriptional regulator
MGSRILRPTTSKRSKSESEWLIQGPWGRRMYVPMTRADFYDKLHRELIDSGVLPADSLRPSNRYHDHVTITVQRSSWIEERWIPDEPFAARLKKLRELATLTQEQLAERSALDVGTVRQLEQGTRTNPQWQTICALARGLEKDIVVFVGTDGWQPPDADADWKRRQNLTIRS